MTSTSAPGFSSMPVLQAQLPQPRQRLKAPSTSRASGLWRAQDKLRAVSLQDALKAAEHGNSVVLAAYLHAGGDPHASARSSHYGWSLLHLASGCSLVDRYAHNLANARNRDKKSATASIARPEPESPDGFATCVSLLLAAGTDPNAPSRKGNYTALVGACMAEDVEGCRLLLQAGAQPSLLAQAYEPTPLNRDPSSNGSGSNGSGTEGQKRRLQGTDGDLTLPPPLRNQPARLLPRSPLGVAARLLEGFENGEERERDVEVRWLVPPAHQMALVGSGQVQRYVVRSYVKGEEVEVVQSSTAVGSSRRAPRRDFCKNQVMDRGIALRQHLNLSQPRTASTLVHGLAPGTTYHFTVSCIASVQGALRESPPSLMSKPLDVPSVEEEEWNMGEILDKVFAYGLAPGGPGGVGGRISSNNSTHSSSTTSNHPAVAGGSSSNRNSSSASSASSASNGGSGSEIGALPGEVVTSGSNTNSGIVHWGTMGSPQRMSSSSEPQSPLSAEEPPSPLLPISESGLAFEAVPAAAAPVDPSDDSSGSVDHSHSHDERLSTADATAASNGTAARVDAAAAATVSNTASSNDNDDSSSTVAVEGEYHKQVAVVSSYWDEEPAADDASNDPDRNARRMEQIALQRQAEVAAEEKMRVEQILEQMRRRQAPNTAIQPARPGGGQGGGSGKGENGSDDCVIS